MVIWKGSGDGALYHWRSGLRARAGEWRKRPAGANHRRGSDERPASGFYPSRYPVCTWWL